MMNSRLWLVVAALVIVVLLGSVLGAPAQTATTTDLGGGVSSTWGTDADGSMYSADTVDLGGGISSTTVYGGGSGTTMCTTIDLGGGVTSTSCF